MNLFSGAAVACLLMVSLLSSVVKADNQRDLGHEIKASWGLNVEVGAAMRTRKQSNRIINPGDLPNPALSNAGANGDDGNLNFNRGDLTKGGGKVVGHLKLQRRAYGAYVSAYAWKDFVESHAKVPHGHAPNQFQPNQKLSDSGFDRRAKFQGAVWQQAFVYGRFTIADRPVVAKLGRQIVRWGSSAYRDGSFKTMNAINIAAHHRPGVSGEEIFIPTNMLHVDARLTPNTQLKGLYQLEWRRAIIDGCGTFLGNNDNAGGMGCHATFQGSDISSQEQFAKGNYFRRVSDKRARNSGQWGLKLDHALIAKKANVSGYFFNYHSRLPNFSVNKTTNPAPTTDAPGPHNSTTIQYDYPEDIKVYGVTADYTFSKIGNLLLNVSYVDKLPLQINTAELVGSSAASALGAPKNPNIPQGTWDYVSGHGLGEHIKGYKRYAAQRAELVFTRQQRGILNADGTHIKVTLAYENIPNLPSQADYRFGRPSLFGTGKPGEKGYVTRESWGYDVVVQLLYKQAIGPIDLKPTLQISNGIKGYSGDNSFRKGVSRSMLALNASAGDANVRLAYRHFGQGTYSNIRDRDYLEFSVGYKF